MHISKTDSTSDQGKIVIGRSIADDGHRTVARVDRSKCFKHGVGTGL